MKREEKLSKLREARSISGIDNWQEISPDKHHDWIGQRDEAFQKLYPMGSKDAKAGKTDDTIFKLYSRGLATSRDAYIYNFSHEACARNARAMVDDYWGALQELSAGNQGSLELDEIVKRHSSNVRWDQALEDNLKRKKSVKYSSDNIWKTQYRPFVKQHCYVEYVLVNRKYQMDRIFPTNESENRVICVPGVGSTKPFSVLVVDRMPDIQFMFNGQYLPRYRYERRNEKQQNLLDDSNDVKHVDNISDTALRKFRVHYNDSTITKDAIFDYVYGILHDSMYRERFRKRLGERVASNSNGIGILRFR